MSACAVSVQETKVEERGGGYVRHQNPQWSSHAQLFASSHHGISQQEQEKRHQESRVSQEPGIQSSVRAWLVKKNPLPSAGIRSVKKWGFLRIKRLVRFRGSTRT